MQGRIKQSYKFGFLQLLGGLHFTKKEWTTIPAEKEEEARTTLADILDFQEQKKELGVILEQEPEPAQELPSVEEEELGEGETSKVTPSSSRKKRK